MRKLKKEFVYIFYILFIILSITLSIVFYQKYKQEHVIKEITYKGIDNSSYDVYYTGSDIINGKVIQDEYIKKYTDKISLNYDYTLEFSDVVSGTQEVLAKASLIVYAPNSSSEIYKSDIEYLIKNKKLEYENSNQYKYKNSIEIDYQKYVDLYNQIKNETSIISDAKISIEFISSSIAKTKGIAKITKTDNIIYDIPLSSVTYSINKKTNIENNSKVYKQIDNNQNRLYLYSFYGCVFVLIIFLTMFINKIIEYGKNKNNYRQKLNKILKTYDNIIVDVKEIPNFGDKNVINVTSFEELLDAQMEMRLPINYLETIKGYEAKFVIVTNDIAWIYILRKKEGMENEK